MSKQPIRLKTLRMSTDRSAVAAIRSAMSVPRNQALSSVVSEVKGCAVTAISFSDRTLIFQVEGASAIRFSAELDGVQVNLLDPCQLDLKQAYSLIA